MNHLDRYIERSESILTGKNNLEDIATFRNFPVFMGCVSTEPNTDIFADMDWGIDPASGIIQLRKLIPLEILYLNQHNDGIGKIWKDLYAQFAGFIHQHALGNKILEIGGAHDEIAVNFIKLDAGAKWTIVEPNPENISNNKLKVIKAWFDENFSMDEEVDTIIHSHVLEHTFNPSKFIGHVANFLKVGQRHIFAVPNMLPMLESKFTNCLDFEHTILLTEYFVDYLLAKSGFKIIEKRYFGDPHSIFYATEKVASDSVAKPALENKYGEYKHVFLNFVSYHKTMVQELNKKISQCSQAVYLFGAHIFSQYLINFGLDVGKIVSVLDNSTLKQGKRLYGTKFQVESPKILAGQGSVIVVLKAGIYNDEIKKDILENINPNVIFL